MSQRDRYCANNLTIEGLSRNEGRTCWELEGGLEVCGIPNNFTSVWSINGSLLPLSGTTLYIIMVLIHFIPTKLTIYGVFLAVTPHIFGMF